MIHKSDSQRFEKQLSNGLPHDLIGKLVRSFLGWSLKSSPVSHDLFDTVFGHVKGDVATGLDGMPLYEGAYDGFHYAPRGLVAALAESLGLPADAAPEMVARAASGIRKQAEHIAQECMTGNLTNFIGPGKILATKQQIQPEHPFLQERSWIQRTLVNTLANYMNALRDLITAETSIREMTTPVSKCRCAWADAAICEEHVRELWGTPATLASSSAPWSRLGIGAAVLDGALPSELLMRARQELQDMAARKDILCDGLKDCNPGSQNVWINLGSKGDRSGVSSAVIELGERLACLPGALEAVAVATEVAAPGTLDIPRMRLNPSIMAATYGYGSYYIPHLDKYSAGSYGFLNSRVLTLICYLNPDWQPGDGGELRLYATAPHDAVTSNETEESSGTMMSLLGIDADHSESTLKSRHDETRYVDVDPLLGRIVMFRSKDVWHGIQELNDERWAVTLWVLGEGT